MNQTTPVETQGLRRPQKQIQKRTLLLSWHSGVVASALQQPHNDTGSNQASKARAAESPDEPGDVRNYIAIKRSLGGAHENSHDHAKSKQTNRNAVSPATDFFTVLMMSPIISSIEKNLPAAEASPMEAPCGPI